MVTLASMSILGSALQTSFTLESNPTTAKIPSHWQNFFSTAIANQIPNPKEAQKTYAVYTNYTNEYKGDYSLIIGAEVAHNSVVPTGLAQAIIPAGQYMVFTAQGQMPHTVIDTWKEIWSFFDKNKIIKRAYKTDFEVYDVSNPNTALIYIGLANT
jgi:predicted transcriptional regulator YdeE